MRTRPTGNGMEIVEVAPTHCPNGHRLAYPNVMVSWLPCTCAPDQTGHRSYTCRTCDWIMYFPEHDRTRPGTMNSLYDS